MANQDDDNKFTWIIKDFTSLEPNHIYSDYFVIAARAWRLLAYPTGIAKANYLSLFLSIGDTANISCGWRIHAKYQLTVVNQLSDKLSIVKGVEGCWFSKKVPSLGFREMLCLDALHAKGGGFLVKGEVKIVVEIDVHGVSIDINVVDEPREATQQPMKKVKLEEVVKSNDSLLEKTTKKSVDVNGFQVLPSQVEFVKRIFEKHPDMALEFRAKNQHLKTACMNVLINLIQTICQSVQELSEDDLIEADSALTYVKDSGFKVDWLEKKLEEVKDKKKEDRVIETRMQELEDELENFKQKFIEIEALLDEEKAKRASPLELDDVL